MKKPTTKVCNKCGVTVHPDWLYLQSPINGVWGYVSDSVCPSCSHEMTHISGTPEFVIPLYSVMKATGRIY